MRIGSECEKLIDKLPANVAANVVGPVPYDAGLQHLFASHFFVLPTLNENFGYVLLKAWPPGRRCLTSENVVWDDLEEKNVRPPYTVGRCPDGGAGISRNASICNDEFTEYAKLPGPHENTRPIGLHGQRLRKQTEAVFERALGSPDDSNPDYLIRANHGSGSSARSIIPKRSRPAITSRRSPKGWRRTSTSRSFCGQPNYAARGTVAPKHEFRNGTEIFRSHGHNARQKCDPLSDH